jgi:hypothetical protein
MEKYSKNNLNEFKKMWSDANFQRISEIGEEMLKDTNENIRILFPYMKRSCGDYLYKANLIWDN